MKKIIFFLFLFFSFLAISNGYTETIIDDQLANCFNDSLPVAINQSAHTWTGNIRFFCVSKYDHAWRIYDENWNSIQTYWTWIYNSNTTRWNDSDMKLEMSFNIYNDHYDIIWVIDDTTSTTENTRWWYWIIKNWVIISNFVTAWWSRSILITNWYLYQWSNKRVTLSTWLLRVQNHSLWLSTWLIIFVENIGTTTNMVYYVWWKYYLSKIDFIWEDNSTISTREILINKSSLTSLFPLETLWFPIDLNTYTGVTIDKAILNSYLYNDWEGDDAVRYVLSLCKENTTFQFTTTEDHHYVSLAWDLPSYNITDTLWFYDTKSKLYYDWVFKNWQITTYIWMQEKPFLPLQYYCKNNYWYTDFSNNIPQSVIYVNNDTSETYSLKKAVLNSWERDTITTTTWWGPWWSTTEQLNPDWSVTDTEITTDLFDFDIDWDWEVEAWEWALAPYTFLKNLVNKILISAQNFWKIIKSFQWLWNISFIPSAEASDTIWGQAFFDNFSNTFQWEGENAAMNDIAQKWKQTIYIILLLIVIIFWFYSLKKN